MSLFRFGNLERELDFTDADFLDRLDDAYEKIQEDVKELPKDGKNSDIVRAQNACYDRFFDNILGEGASRELFDTNSLSRRIDAAEALAEFRQAEDDRFSSRIVDYRVNKPPKNRKQRRSDQKYGKRNYERAK